MRTAASAAQQPMTILAIDDDAGDAAHLQHHIEASADMTTVVAVEDDAGDIELLRRCLEQITDFKFEIVHCTTAQVAQTALKARPSSIVFLDYQLGAEDGLQALEEVRSTGFPGPIVVLTGQGDEYIVAKLMRSGADYYVRKSDMTPEIIRRAIRNAQNQYSRRKTEAYNRQLLEELQTTKKSLKRKNQRLTELYETAHQFVDNVSHEFRTPLTVIREFTSILRDGLAGEVNDEQREYLDIALNRTDDLSTMVDDMLDISKLEAGVLGVSRRNCMMGNVVDNVRATLERKALASKVGLKIDVPESLPAVYCDAEKIGRVLINLTVNAIKFCDEGGHVRVAVSRADETQLGVRVTDDGPGIAPENLQSIFERFKQVDGDVRSSTQGFGLGLSIAKELVHLNFGMIDVSSELGRGSTFSFTVPIADPRVVLSLCLQRLCSYAVSLLIASVNCSADRETLHDVDEFLQHQLHRNDLLFRASSTVWVVVAAVDQLEVDQIGARLDRRRVEINRNRPSHKLPQIMFDVRGTWRVGEQGPALLSRFEAEFASVVRSPHSSGAPLWPHDEF